MKKHGGLLNAHLNGDTFLLQGGEIGVLLSHGFTATTTEVRLLGERLHANGYTVYAPLLPGHGTSPDDMNRLRWQDWAAAIEEAYQFLTKQCRTVFVGGESMGGLLALYCASRNDGVAGVMTYTPALKLKLTRSEVARVYAFSPFIAHTPPKPSPPTVVDERWKGYPVRPLKALVQLIEFGKVVRRALPQVRQPLLNVMARLDRSVDPVSGDIIMREVASTDKAMHWMENSVHCVLLDHELPEVAGLTLEFLRRYTMK